jgi:hypothetical protein
MTDVKQLRRVRHAVRATLVLGVAVSVAGNMLHAQPNWISRAIAAWSPLALLLTIELISRVPVHRRWLSACRLIATAVIAGIAAFVSYWHMAGVASKFGESGASPFLLPLSVDGLIVVASICLVELGGRIRAVDVAPRATSAAPRPVFEHDRPIGPMPAPPRPPGKQERGTADDTDSAGQRQWQDPRSEQDREAAVCAMRAVAPKASLRQISAATLVPVSTVRNILNRSAAQEEPTEITQINCHEPDLEGAKS